MKSIENQQPTIIPPTLLSKKLTTYSELLVLVRIALYNQKELIEQVNSGNS